MYSTTGIRIHTILIHLIRIAGFQTLTYASWNENGVKGVVPS